MSIIIFKIIKNHKKNGMMKMKDNKGFSLIEALIATAIVSIALIGLAGMQGIFATQTVDRTVQNSLVDAASSALTHCQNVSTTPGTLSFTYENNIVVSVALTGDCNPGLDSCNTVTATASARERSFPLTTRVCNFR